MDVVERWSDHIVFRNLWDSLTHHIIQGWLPVQRGLPGQVGSFRRYVPDGTASLELIFLFSVEVRQTLRFVYRLMWLPGDEALLRFFLDLQLHLPLTLKCIFDVLFVFWLLFFTLSLALLDSEVTLVKVRPDISLGWIFSLQHGCDTVASLPALRINTETILRFVLDKSTLI